MTNVLSPAHVAAVLRGLRERGRDDPVIGIHSPAPWTGSDRLRAHDEEFEVAQCRSPLEIRERLNGRHPKAPPLVLITALEDADLGDDVRARIYKRRLLTVEAWSVVEDLFRARGIDPRLGRHPWIAEALIKAAPAGGFPPAPGGIVSLEAAWGVLLQSVLGLQAARPDGTALLQWTMLPGAAERFAAAPQEMRGALRQWLADSAGPVGPAILQCLELGHGKTAVPLGLVCGVVFGEDAASGGLSAAKAQVRLEERYIGGGSPRPALVRWAHLAEAIVLAELETHGLDAVRPWLRRAEEILGDIGAADQSHRSHVLLSGFEQRLAAFAEAVTAAVETLGPEALSRVQERAARVLDHGLAAAQVERVARVEMAARLCCWLATPAANHGSFAEAAASYAAEGAFVDWARSVLRGGDSHAQLSQAFELLLAGAGARREEQNRRFAELLRGWLEADSAAGDLIPIEDVLGRIVAPLAGEAPALLLVLDGLSYATFEDLVEDLTLRGWVPLRQGEDGESATSGAVVIAALPTVTEVCRASLLTGHLREGGQTAEKQGFAAHPRLAAVSSAKMPPLLLHKGDLLGRSETALSDDVRARIASPEQRVVGVVLNAVDDHLLKSDQVRPRWKAEYLQHLLPILQAAEEAGRVVILTSDHGHVLEVETQFRKGSQSDRWRLDDGNLREDEIRLQGRRVVTTAGDAIIAPWSEKVRYGPKKNGYHGGATPQEVVVPLAVLVSPGIQVPGWKETAIRYPDWWAAEPVDVVPRRVPAPAQVVPIRPRARPRPAPAPGQQGHLFGDARDGEPREGEAPAEPRRDWIANLFASPIYQAQKATAGRVAADDERVRAVLEALASRGGKLSHQALAQRLGIPPIRVRGTVSAMRRVLNVEGYGVLSEESDSETVSLNVELLRVQFGIG